MPAWAENATFAGTKIVRGEVCYSYLIAGTEASYLHIRAADGQICELDVAMSTFFEFSKGMSSGIRARLLCPMTPSMRSFQHVFFYHHNHHPICGRASVVLWFRLAPLRSPACVRPLCSR